ncbi:MAG: phage terminase large subunit family protein [Planctomycetaceae bacterium]|nr:phage terminase large subunit family protein [Planctomycetaceae bacterium]
MPRKDYEKQKESSRNRVRKISRLGREIGPIPARRNPQAVMRSATDLEFFLKTYFPEKFYRPFGKPHLELITQLERIIRVGGRVACALPRGIGKSTTLLGAANWALNFGYRNCVVFIAKKQEEAIKGIEFFKAAYGLNQHLFADFPEICYPINMIEESGHLTRGQTLGGHRTRILWNQDSLRLPTVSDGHRLTPSSGSWIVTGSINSIPRGTRYEGAEGDTLRPDLVLLDDPQDDNIARSPQRVAKVVRDIEGAIKGLAKAGQRIAMAMACTVIQPGDVADTFLDRTKKPKWYGIRYKLLESFPKRMDLWGKYSDLWNEDEEEATEFYREHRQEMDEGAEVNFKGVFDSKSEISELQYAMNLYFENPETFFAEYQNEPYQDSVGDLVVSAMQIRSRVNGRARGIVPNTAEKLTAFIDVHSDIHYWAVAAWDKHLTGWIIDYGTFPKQSSSYFRKNDDGNVTLRRLYPGVGVDEAMRQGARELMSHLIDREFERENGESVGIDKILVDTGFKWSVIEDAMRMLTPAELRLVHEYRGRGFRAVNKPISEFRRMPGLTIGWHWLYKKMNKRSFYTFEVDTNYGKTEVHSGFVVNVGDKGSISLWGNKPEEHRMFADHCAAEAATLVKANGREIYEFFEKPHRPDNHFFDCIVGCRFAASIEGMGPQA